LDAGQVSLDLLMKKSRKENRTTSVSSNAPNSATPAALPLLTMGEDEMDELIMCYLDVKDDSVLAPLWDFQVRFFQLKWGIAIHSFALMYNLIFIYFFLYFFCLLMQLSQSFVTLAITKSFDRGEGTDVRTMSDLLVNLHTTSKISDE
jgi:hypothetical protein